MGLHAPQIVRVGTAAPSAAGVPWVVCLTDTHGRLPGLEHCKERGSIKAAVRREGSMPSFCAMADDWCLRRSNRAGSAPGPLAVATYCVLVFE